MCWSSKSSQIIKSGRVLFQFLPRIGLPSDDASTKLKIFLPLFNLMLVINDSLLSLGFSCFLGDKIGPKSSRNFLLCFSCNFNQSKFCSVTVGVIDSRSEERRVGIECRFRCS